MVSSLPHGNLHFSISGKRFTGTQVHGKAHFRQLIIGKTRWVGAFGLHMHCSDLGGRKGIKCTLIGVDMPITGLGKRGRLDKGDDTLNDVENSRPPSPSWGTQPSSPPRFSGKRQCYPEQAWRVLNGLAGEEIVGLHTKIQRRRQRVQGRQQRQRQLDCCRSTPAKNESASKSPRPIS